MATGNDRRRRFGNQTSGMIIPSESLDNYGVQPRSGVASSEEKVVVRRPSELPGIELWTVNNSARLYTLFHTTYAFCCVERQGGYQSWKYRRKYYNMDTRSTGTIEPGEVHTTLEICDSADYHVLFVSSEVVDNLFLE